MNETLSAPIAYVPQFPLSRRGGSRSRAPRTRSRITAAMDFCSIHLPDLCVASIYGCLETADDLKAAALVCHAGLTQAQAAAQAAVTRLRTNLEADGPTATAGRRADGTAAPWIAELCSWEQTHAAHHVWLDASFCETEPVQELNGTVAEQVVMVVDRSGNGLHAEIELEHEDWSVGPCLVRQGPNGRPVLAFSDGFGGVPCLLQTPRFAAPLTGPITYLCVARAVGDVTLLDSLNEDSPHVELCHGCAPPCRARTCCHTTSPLPSLTSYTSASTLRRRPGHRGRVSKPLGHAARLHELLRQALRVFGG